MKRIGLALGSGGARGLAHIKILEAFEELQIKPNIISGTSIGAIIGAVYAAGISAKEMQEIVYDIIFKKNGRFWEIHKRSDFMKMFDFIDPKFRSAGLIKGERFIKYLGSKIGAETFEELEIPLKIVSTNYWTKEQIILDKGDLLQSIRASYSLPGLFFPTRLNDMILIDGGMVNPLPFDIIKEDCDITVAVDVSAKKTLQEQEMPPSYEVLFSAFQIMQNSIVQAKLNYEQPDIQIYTNIADIRVHEFQKAEHILEEAEKAKDELKAKLQELLIEDKQKDRIEK
jgi:NTE family protein